MKITSVLLVLATLFSLTVFAVDSSEQSQSLDLKNRVKKRLYPGGKDEEPLRVQTLLVSPTRKMNPTTDNPAAEPAEPEAENND